MSTGRSVIVVDWVVDGVVLGVMRLMRVAVSVRVVMSVFGGS